MVFEKILNMKGSVIQDAWGLKFDEDGMKIILIIFYQIGCEVDN